jgi:hypothetical protein
MTRSEIVETIREKYPHVDARDVGGIVDVVLELADEYDEDEDESEDEDDEDFDEDFGDDAT